MDLLASILFLLCVSEPLIWSSLVKVFRRGSYPRSNDLPPTFLPLSLAETLALISARLFFVEELRAHFCEQNLPLP
jgi:hypothetical protein